MGDAMVDPASPAPDGVPRPLDSTAVLLERLRDGDSAARERLFARVLPLLTRWAHARLPARARDLAERNTVMVARAS